MDILSPSNIQNIGLGAALIFSIYTNWKMYKEHNKIIINHMSHETEGNLKLANAIDKLIAFLRGKLK